MPDAPPADEPDDSTFAPLATPAFRWIWAATVVSNVGTWMQSVAAQWHMTGLTDSAALVSMVQGVTAGAIFLLVLPAGVVSDLVNRRRLLIASQVWAMAASATLAACAWAGWLNAPGLLGLTFAVAVGAAVSRPAWQAVVPQLVGRDVLPAALTLNSLAVSMARAVGPVAAGALVAASGPVAAFTLNAASFAAVIAALVKWLPAPPPAAGPREGFSEALAVGLRYALHDPELKSVLLRTSTFMLGAAGLMSLLPLVAADGLELEADGYGLMLGFLGAGSIAGGLLLARLRRWLGAGGVVLAGTAVFAAVTVGVALSPSLWLTGPLLALAGVGWTAVLTGLNVAAQVALPDWVRARGLSIYTFAWFAGLTGGSLGWGLSADALGLRTTLLLAAAATGGTLLLAGRHRLPDPAAAGDLSPSDAWPAVELPDCARAQKRRVLVTLVYRVPVERAAEFAAAMAPLGDARLRTGASRWGLYQDAADPGRWLELFRVPTWEGHLRQHARWSVADQAVQDAVHEIARPEVRSAGDDSPSSEARHWLAPAEE